MLGYSYVCDILSLHAAKHMSSFVFFFYCRLEMLQQIADRVKRDCVAGEDKLTLARTALQSVSLDIPEICLSAWDVDFILKFILIFPPGYKKVRIWNPVAE